MKLNTKLFSLVLLVAAAIACNSTDSQTGLVIDGTIADAGNMKIFIDESTPGQALNVITNAEIDAEGNFEFQLEEGLDAGLYRMRVGTKNAALLLTGDEDQIEFSTDLQSFGMNKFEIAGAPATAELNSTMDRYMARKMQMKDVEEFLENSEHPLAAMQFALTILQNRPDFAPLQREVHSRLEKEYGNAGFVTAYDAFVKGLEGALAARQAQENIKVGMPAPDIAMPDPDGDIRRLSDLKGKVVLLDFWAAWCGPCRKANPHLVETYHKYKDRGFTVFSVSLDGLDERTKQRLGGREGVIEQQMEAQKQRWLAAIEKDNLTWDNHVSELKKWDTPAVKEYGVRGIPRTYLIDREGKIAAINPRFNLQEAIEKEL